MNKTSTKSLSRKLHLIVFVPLIILGTLFAVFTTFLLTYLFESNVQDELSIVANAIEYTYDTLYPGDYTLSEDGVLYKGNTPISSDFSLIDSFYKQTGIHISLFFHDSRILTTIRDDTGLRISNTLVDATVKSEVLEHNQATFYANTSINNVDYLAYYIPLVNANNETIGMIFAGTPNAEMMSMATILTLTIIGGLLLFAILLALPTAYFTKNIMQSFNDLSLFLHDISTGNLAVSLPLNTLKRKDELGHLGNAAVTMQNSLKTLTEQDSLTNLFNRSFADNLLQHVQKQARARNSKFVLILANIDHFKQINHTYGHACGDIVLKSLADRFRAHMINRGRVIRWSGDEFILVYSNIDATFDEACHDLEYLMENIRAMAIPYGQKNIILTVTMGAVFGDANTNIPHLLQDVDKLLEYGKSNGRDQLVYHTNKER